MLCTLPPRSCAKDENDRPKGVTQLRAPEKGVNADSPSRPVMPTPPSDGLCKQSVNTAKQEVHSSWKGQSGAHRPTVRAEIHPAAYLTKCPVLLPEAWPKQQSLTGVRAQHRPGSSHPSARGKRAMKQASSAVQTQRICAMQDCVSYLLPLC